MIKVSVMYPNSPGARFDHEYYRDKHMPLLKARMGSSCKYYTVDKGLAAARQELPRRTLLCVTSSATRSRRINGAFRLTRRRSWAIFRTTLT